MFNFLVIKKVFAMSNLNISCYKLVRIPLAFWSLQLRAVDYSSNILKSLNMIILFHLSLFSGLNIFFNFYCNFFRVLFLFITWGFLPDYPQTFLMTVFKMERNVVIKCPAFVPRSVITMQCINNCVLIFSYQYVLHVKTFQNETCLSCDNISNTDSFHATPPSPACSVAS